MRRTRRQFRPGAPDLLESRVVLSAGVRPYPALVALHGHRAFRRAQPIRISDQIDTAFDSFKADYLQAQAAYLATGDGMASAQPAFRAFIIQRIDLLAQDLTRTLSRLPNSLNRLSPSERSANPNSDVVLQAFLRRQINGPNVAGSLLTTLAPGPNAQATNATLPPPGTSGPAATLYTLTATNAIDAAHSATINAAKFLVNGSFVGKKR